MKMNAKSAMAFTAAMVLSVTAYAHDCSGGASGGMDATGNQCNVVADIATSSATVPDAGAGPGAGRPEPAMHTVAMNQARHSHHKSASQQHAAGTKRRLQG